MTTLAKTNPLVGRLLFIAFAVFFAYFVFDSLRTGKLKFRYGRVYLRSEDPVTFWFHVFVYAIFSLAFLAAAILRK